MYATQQLQSMQHFGLAGGGSRPGESVSGEGREQYTDQGGVPVIGEKQAFLRGGEMRLEASMLFVSLIWHVLCSLG